jgi:hypothetical protein
LFLKIPNIVGVLTSIGIVLLSIDAVLASIVAVLALLRTFRAFTPYLKNVLPVPVFILSRSTDSITYRLSQIDAVYPRNLVLSATINNFATSNNNKMKKEMKNLWCTLLLLIGGCLTMQAQNVSKFFARPDAATVDDKCMEPDVKVNFADKDASWKYILENYGNK